MKQRVISWQEIVPLIPSGKQYAVSKPDLCRKFGLNCDRYIRFAVEEARQHGVPIAANPQRGGGYYIPLNPSEAADYIQMEKNRMTTVIHNTQNLIKNLQKKFGLMDELPLETSGAAI